MVFYSRTGSGTDHGRTMDPRHEAHVLRVVRQAAGGVLLNSNGAGAVTVAGEALHSAARNGCKSIRVPCPPPLSFHFHPTFNPMFALVFAYARGRRSVLAELGRPEEVVVFNGDNPATGKTASYQLVFRQQGVLLSAGYCFFRECFVSRVLFRQQVIVSSTGTGLIEQ